MSDKRQKNQLELAFMDESRSEAPRASTEGTESLAAKRGTESLAIGEQLMEEVCERENCKQALARVKANKGTPGVDGMTVHELPEFLKQHWPAIRRRREKTRHSFGAGSIHPASGDAGAATQVGPDVFRSQLRVSARALGGSGGGSGAAVHRRRLSLGGGS